MIERSRRSAWIGAEPPVRRSTDDLVSEYPTHIPLGLPLPKPEDDRPDGEYTL